MVIKHFTGWRKRHGLDASCQDTSDHQDREFLFATGMLGGGCTQNIGLTVCLVDDMLSLGMDIIILSGVSYHLSIVFRFQHSHEVMGSHRIKRFELSEM